MPKAPLIRADTIDLQDHSAPSAKDHSRQPASPNPLGEGPPAPHQAASLRHASLDDSSLVGRSPRASQDLSGKELQLLQEIHSEIDEQDAAEIEASLGITRGTITGDQGAGGQGHQHDGDGSGEEEEEMDDDMMDKISSSPSIDDGGYSHPWRGGADVGGSLCCHSRRQRCENPPCAAASPSAIFYPYKRHHSSSPYSETPEHLPLGFIREISTDSGSLHHQPVPGEYPATPELDEEDKSSNGSDTLESPSFKWNFDTSNSSLDLPMYLETESGLCDSELEMAADRLGFFREHREDDLESSNDSDASYCSNGSGSEINLDVLDHATWLQPEGHFDDDIPEDVWNEAAYELNSQRTDSGWGDECLQETEDIDFEFVYALHTFVATVEGQANATKGDTMVLLDDSNSYWWLVRVVKDSSIGYLPAEHIETPTERLARLNKHRNIDLSQTMLGDNPEKSRNPLKKAMRRRNVKTVTFTDPTYYEPDPEEYSSDEEDEEPDFITTADPARDQSNEQQQQDQQAQRQQQQAQQQQYDQDDDDDTSNADQEETEPAKVQPLRIRTVAYDQQREKGQGGKSPTSATSPKTDPRIDRPRASEESVDSSDGGTAKSPRRMRNTDSFYKDESIETRKISLTPNLLRDDSASGGGSGGNNNSASVNSGVQEARASLEGTKERQESVDKGKEEKKKDKKPSKFSGFFKRKNSKSKPQPEEETEEWHKDSLSSRGASPAPKQSQESMSTTDPAPSSPVKTQPSRQSSKLQKSQKGGSLRRANSKDEPGAQRSPTTEQTTAPKLDAPHTGPDLDPFDDSAAYDGADQGTQKSQAKGRSADDSGVASPTSDTLRNVFNPIRGVFHGGSSTATHQQQMVDGEPKLEKVKPVKNRMALDDSDSDDDEVQDPTASFPAAPTRHAPDARDRLSESPVQVSLGNGPGPQITHHQHPSGAPALVADVSPQSSNAVSPVSPSSSPELVERPADEMSGAYGAIAKANEQQQHHYGIGAANAARTMTPTGGAAGAVGAFGMTNGRDGDAASAKSGTPVSATGSSRSRAPEWSDAMLRDYMDRCGDEFRDMLAIVYAPPGKEPEVNRDDPIWKRHEQHMARYDEVQKKLDRVLMDFYKSRGVEF